MKGRPRQPGSIFRPRPRAINQYQAKLIREAFDRSNGVQRRAAELLKLSPTTLNEMVHRLRWTFPALRARFRARFLRGATFNIVGPMPPADGVFRVSNNIENGTSTARGT